MSSNFIKTSADFYKTREFLKYRLTNKSVIYEFLRAAIIRASFVTKRWESGGNYICNNFFKKRKLVSRYPQTKIGKFMGMSRNAVSQHIKALVKDGFIKVHKRKVSAGTACYYELGWYDGEFGKPSYKEHYYLDIHFAKVYAKDKKARDAEKYVEDDSDEVLEVEKETKAAAEEYRDAVLKFPDPDGFIKFAMGAAKRSFDDNEIEQHRCLWNEVHAV